jgi:hypothetical protein
MTIKQGHAVPELFSESHSQFRGWNETASPVIAKTDPVFTCRSHNDFETLLIESED